MKKPNGYIHTTNLDREGVIEKFCHGTFKKALKCARISLRASSECDRSDRGKEKWGIDREKEVAAGVWSEQTEKIQPCDDDCDHCPYDL